MFAANQHVGIAVPDIDRAGEFYIEALDGRWLWEPVLMEGKEAAKTGIAPAFKCGMIGFSNGCLELFELIGVERPQPAMVPHFALHVDDVEEARRRIEAAGGRSLWDEPLHVGEMTCIYSADPDGNVIELLDTDLEGLVRNFTGAGSI
jgi:predicted enzyme related to lactoylglutathione lyase